MRNRFTQGLVVFLAGAALWAQTATKTQPIPIGEYIKQTWSTLTR